MLPLGKSLASLVRRMKIILCLYAVIPVLNVRLTAAQPHAVLHQRWRVFIIAE